MSTPSSSPLGYPPSASELRASARAQRRAAKAKARWQREEGRKRLRASERRSVTGPILLVAVGVLLLLLETGRLSWAAGLAWLSFWWPAVLIGAGLLMVLEWALDTGLHRGDSARAPRRVLGGTASTLLFLVALAGASLMAARRSSSWVQNNFHDQLAGHDFGNWQQLFSTRSEVSSELSAPLAPHGELFVDNPRGDVTVTGSSQDGQVHVAVRQHLASWNQDNLGRRQLHERPRFSGDPNHLRLAALPEGNDDADLTVTLPHDASLEVRSRHGDVSVEELHGGATITALAGDVKLTALRGPVHLKTSDDDTTVTAHSLGGGLVLEGQSGDIDLSDIQGNVTLHGDFFGTTEMARIRGPVTFDSSFTHLSCGGVPGSLSIEGRNDLTAHQLDGPVNIATTDRNLTLDGLHGATSITNRNGSVSASLVAPLGSLHISNANGPIAVSTPDHQAFTLKAQTDNGKIETGFGLAIKKLNGVTAVKDKVLGGGPLIDLQTSDEDIRVNHLGKSTESGGHDTSATFHSGAKADEDSGEDD